MDVLDTILLSLHPNRKLEVPTLSDYTRDGLADMQNFKHVILDDMLHTATIDIRSDSLRSKILKYLTTCAQV